MFEDKLTDLVNIIKSSKNTVFFGGAGVSTESNIPDFRSEAGLYEAEKKYGYSPEEMLSRNFFIHHRTEFFKYYKENLIHLEARPNKAHEVLAKLEEMSLLSAVITQNVDGLHQAAGSKNVIELHGANSEQYCIKCGQGFSVNYILDDANCKDLVPLCPCGGVVRPDIVLYGETLKESVLIAAISAIASADCLIVGGTSLVVYPAAGLINYFRGKNLVLINKAKTGADGFAGLVIHHSIGEVLSSVMLKLRH